MPENKKVLIICVLLALACLLTFWRVNLSDFVSYDDTAYVTENSHIQSGLTLKGIEWAFTTGHASNWHPLTWLSHMLDVQLFGLNPGWHHFINLLFHIANTVLLFLVLHRATKALWQSAFVAALFALHPLHVESVAWVAERKDVLSTFFWMLTMWVYLSYTARPGVVRYLSLLLCFALGLMAKPMLVTLPFVLLLLDYWPLQRLELGKQPRETLNPPPQAAQKRKEKGRRRPAEAPARPAVSRWALIRPLLVEKVPLCILVVLSCSVTYMVQKKGGAVGSIENFPLGVRVENAFVSYITYIAKMIWPSNLAVFYPYGSLLPWQVVWAVSCFIAMTVMAARAAKRFPYLTVGWLWYAGTLIPVIGFVQVGRQALADRYTYVPLIGLFVMAAWGIPELARWWRHRKKVLIVFSALTISCCFIIAWNQVGYWRNSLTLYDHALSVTDDNDVIYYNRGNAYMALGDRERAIRDYDKAIGIDPKLPEPYCNRGNAYMALGDRERAIRDYDKAIGIDPRFAAAFNGRGNIYATLGDYRRALHDFTRAVEIDSQFVLAYSNRGASYAILGEYRRAIEDFDRVLSMNPRFVQIYNYRGYAYESVGNHRQAIEDYNKALEINPRFALAYNNRGSAYRALGNYQEAIADFDKAIVIDPRFVLAYRNRAALSESLGNKGQAHADLERAAMLGDKDAQCTLQASGERQSKEQEFNPSSP